MIQKKKSIWGTLKKWSLLLLADDEIIQLFFFPGHLRVQTDLLAQVVFFFLFFTFFFIYDI